MAYDIIGQIEHIGQTESFPSKTGGTFNKRTLVLKQRRFDQNTGEEFTPNYPKLEFTGNSIGKLDGFKPGDRVRVRFDVSGTLSPDQSGAPRYITNLRGFSVEHYVPQGQPVQQPQPVQPVQFQQGVQAAPPYQQPVQQAQYQQQPQPQQLPF